MNPKKIKWKDVFEVLTAIGTLTLAFFAYLAWKESITSSELATRALTAAGGGTPRLRPRWWRRARRPRQRKGAPRELEGGVRQPEAALLP